MNDTTTHSLTEIQMRRFNQLGHQLNRLGLNMLIFDGTAQCVLRMQAGEFESEPEQVVQGISQNPAEKDIFYWHLDRYLVCGVSQPDCPDAIAVVDTGNNHVHQAEQEKTYLKCLVEAWLHQYAEEEKLSGQIDKIGNELSQAYEEIILLYNLSSNMKVTQSNSTYLQMACDQLTQFIQVEGIAIILERFMEGHKDLVLVAGSGFLTIDAASADILQMHLASELHEGKDALLDSDVDGPFKYSWPAGVKNLIAVPLGDVGNMTGLLVATNVLNKPDFDTTDIKLFNAVANQCRVFIDNNRLFDELKELFIGSLKALTNSIDAKDQYTRGHSERVAFISRWIGEQLAKTQPISEKQIHYIYLAGLLHDIGKIGVSEAVLRKRGKLTDEERALIQAHPRIGAAILSDIRQMDHIVPGVLGHHERVDGNGYPQGLSEEDIPLVARIICLADAFDAMTSKRVYRSALSIQTALDEIEKGIGTQFDRQVARAFLDSDIDKLWQIIQDGFIERWDYSNFEEYGVSAVGALLR